MPGFIHTQPVSINKDGEIIGTYQNEGRSFVRDKEGNLTTFSVPGFPFTTSSVSINEDGEITGYYVNLSTFVRRGFLRDEEGNITTFDALAGGGPPPQASTRRG